jgi:hypothetical protein
VQDLINQIYGKGPHCRWHSPGIYAEGRRKNDDA